MAIVSFPTLHVGVPKPRRGFDGVSKSLKSRAVSDDDRRMLCLTRLNGSQVYVSPVHIVTIESTPDTLVHLYNGERMMVRETPEQISELLNRFIRGMDLAPIIRLVPPVRHNDDEESGVG